LCNNAVLYCHSSQTPDPRVIGSSLFCHRANLLNGCRTKYVHQIFPRGLPPSVQQIDFSPPTHFQDHLRRIRVPTGTIAQKKIAILLKPVTTCRHRSKHVVIGERKLPKTRAADAQRDRHALREFDLARFSHTRGGCNFSANTCHEYPSSSPACTSPTPMFFATIFAALSS
ncbi:hypothetical protein, partial [Ralstonia solanacearum]|uniref:hypothetical protein n=1 Tax=Ralstonia solanacearum TaxID=305 RepID=UPI001E388E26